MIVLKITREENVVGFRHSALNLLEAALLTITFFSSAKSSPQGLRWELKASTYFSYKGAAFILCFIIHTFFQHLTLKLGWQARALAYHYTPHCEEKIVGQEVNIASCLAKSSAIVFQHVNLNPKPAQKGGSSYSACTVCLCV